MAEVESQAAPAEKPVARIVTDVPRSKEITLQFPIEFDGKTFNAISVRRLSGVEVQAYVERITAGHRSFRVPTIDCPDEVFEALDDDDRYALEVAGLDFLPRRLREQVDALISESSEES